LLVEFLREVLKNWDGSSKRDLILDCFAYSPFSDFDGMCRKKK